LPYVYICIMNTREKGVLEVLGWFIYKIFINEVDYIVYKAKVSKNSSKYTIIQERKELHNIKYYYTIF